MGARSKAGDQSVVGRRQGVRRLAFGKDRTQLPTVERSGARICYPRGHHDTILVGRHDLNRAGQLRRLTYGCSRRKGEYRRKTVPVDSFAANPWGLYQVHGNVYEWVEDCWNRNHIGAPSDGSAWITGDCARRVMRGGSWQFAPWHLRSAARGAVAIAADFRVVGMRAGRSLRR